MTSRAKKLNFREDVQFSLKWDSLQYIQYSRQEAKQVSI